MKRTMMMLMCLLAAGLLVASEAAALSGGITGVSSAGCTPCHGIAGTENTTTEVHLIGVPARYVPGNSYDITVFVEGIALPAPLAAGFNVKATKGSLIPLDNTAKRVGLDATHRSPKMISVVYPAPAGDLPAAPGVTWNLRWDVPALTTGPVTFTAAGNIVNRTGSNDPGDIWSVMAPITIQPQ